MSLCATVAATASARGGDGFALGISHTARTAAQVAEARDDALDVATSAVEVAHAVQVEGSEASVDAVQLAALEAATVKLNDLIEAVDPDSAADAADGLAADSTPATDAAADAAADPAADAAADPSADAAADPAADAAADPSMDPAAEPAAVPATESYDAPAVTAVAADGTVGNPTPAAQPIDAAATPTASPAADAAPAPSPTPSVIPALPPTTGMEDEATTELRDAVAAVAELAATVRESAEANRVAAAAAAQAAAEAASAAQAQAAAAAAAAQAAAEAAAAQRAAWKQSLQGFANGEIPDSALCGVSFDAQARMRCDAAEQLEAMNVEYKAHFGVDMAITDSYRSYAGQVSCVRTKGSLCAKPGTSNHGFGVAIDFGGGIQTFGSAQHEWMDEHAGSWQWVHPDWAEPSGNLPEAWHWEYHG